jgi:subtilisin family serine protease
MAAVLPQKGVQTVENKRVSTYYTLNGTSFAAPHVVGALSLLLGKYPELTQTQAISLLRQSARQMPGGEKISISGGSLDLHALLSAK